MVKQVSSVIQKGYGEEWNGCMRSGKCCSFFVISLNEELYSKMHHDIRELWLAHYGADNVKNLPHVELPINHVCSKLRTQYTKRVKLKQCVANMIIDQVFVGTLHATLQK